VRSYSELAIAGLYELVSKTLEYFRKAKFEFENTEIIETKQNKFIFNFSTMEKLFDFCLRNLPFLLPDSAACWGRPYSNEEIMDFMLGSD
jgi:hypothetical protein